MGKEEASPMQLLVLLLLVDIRSIPIHLKAFCIDLKSWWRKLWHKKLYEEYNLFFVTLHCPIEIIKILKDRQLANKRKISLLQFYEQQTLELKAQNEQMKKNNQILNAELIQEFANLVPGATINDFNYFFENRPILSIRYAIVLLKGWLKI